MLDIHSIIYIAHMDSKCEDTLYRLTKVLSSYKVFYTLLNEWRATSHCPPG